MAAAEVIQTKIASIQIDYYANKQRDPSLRELAEEFCNDDEFVYVVEQSRPIAALSNTVSNDATAIYVILSKYPYEYKIGTDLKIESIDGIVIAEVKQAAEEENGGTAVGINTTITDNPAGAEHILKDHKAYVNGELVTGNINSKASETYTPGTINQTISAGQYLSGDQTIEGDENLVAGNIKKDVEIFSVTGTYQGMRVYYVGSLNIITGNNGVVTSTFDIKNIYEDYANLTFDNFVFQIAGIYDHWNTNPGLTGG